MLRLVCLLATLFSLSHAQLDLDSLSEMLGIGAEGAVEGLGLGPAPDTSKCNEDIKQMMADFNKVIPPSIQMFIDPFTGRSPLADFRNKLFGQFIDCEKFTKDVMGDFTKDITSQLTDLTDVGKLTEGGIPDPSKLALPDASDFGGDLLSGSASAKVSDFCMNFLKVKERKCKNMQAALCDFIYENKAFSIEMMCDLIKKANSASGAELNCRGVGDMLDGHEPRLVFNTAVGGAQTGAGISTMCEGIQSPQTAVAAAKQGSDLAGLLGGGGLDGILGRKRK